LPKFGRGEDDLLREWSSGLHRFLVTAKMRSPRLMLRNIDASLGVLRRAPELAALSGAVATALDVLT
jgi:hypothetical protein